LFGTALLALAVMPVKSAAGRISNGLILTPGCFEINTSRSALPEFDDELTAKTGSPRLLSPALSSIGWRRGREQR
jgi:hypothetical protein